MAFKPTWHIEYILIWWSSRRGVHEATFGFAHPNFPTHVYKLWKSIYSLKQAPWAWFAKLNNRLFSFGFQGSISDTSLFILRKPNVSKFVLVYIDDIVVTTLDSSVISNFMAFLGSSFSVEDLGLLHYFLSVQIHRT